MSYKSPLRWAGGKSKALDRIAECMPDLSTIKDYREPFVGGGSVFLHFRDSFSPGCSVWINDLFKPLCKFWTAAQITNDLLFLSIELDMHEIGDYKFHFEGLKRLGADYWVPNDFFFMNRCAFSGNLTGGFSKHASINRYTYSALLRVKGLEEPLKDVIITCQDYETVINSSGKAGETFLFLDPPYLGIKGLYNHTSFDHSRLARNLQESRYRFMLTYNDHPDIWKYYDWAYIEPLEIQYGMDNVAGNKPKKAQELLIRNYTS